MATLDTSVVNLALPTMGHTFRAAASEMSPVVSAYLIAVVASLLLVGAVGDRRGRRRLYLVGMALFTASSALCAVAWSLQALVAFRALQGLGGAMMFSLGPALLVEVFPPQERGKALGWIASSVAAGQTAGPVVGGVLIGAFGWPSIFLVNLPIGVVSYLWASGVLKGVQESARFRAADGSLLPFDRKGAVLLPTTMIALMVALEAVPIAGATSLLALGGFAVGAVALVMLGRVERKAGAPLVPLAVLRNREFVAANASCVLSFAAIGGVFFVIPFYLKGVLGFPEFRMGLALLPIPIAIAVVGPLAGRLSDRIGSRIPCAAGLSLASAAVFSLSTLTTTSGDLDLVWRLASFGAGMALFQAPNNSSAMGAVARPLLGLASGFLSTMRSLGLAIGVAIAALLLSAFYAAQTGGVPLPPGDVRPDAAAFVGAQALTFLVIAGVAAAGVVTSLVRGSGAARPEGAPVTASSRGK